MLRTKLTWQRAFLLVVSVLTTLTITLQAQTFSSGSTGADGDFKPTASTTIQVPESGVFNYKTVEIPVGVTILYRRNSKNTPITILATGDVTIAGIIDVSGDDALRQRNGFGGPGGFNGGIGGLGLGDGNGVRGEGPGGGESGKSSASGTDGGGGGGGGYATKGSDGISNNSTRFGKGGEAYGSKTLLPLIGGSGGGGGGAFLGQSPGGGGGGGGGGAILIASSGTISFIKTTGNPESRGTIRAKGGPGGIGQNNTGGGTGNAGGGGAGGGIRLMANTIKGEGVLDAKGGGGGTYYYSGGSGAPGYIRIEAYNVRDFNPSAEPGIASYTFPGVVTLPNQPLLKIVTIAGKTVPASPLGSFQGPDLSIPLTVTNPVTVALQATNIPVGTIVKVAVTPETGTPTTVDSTALSGTDASSQATAQVTLPQGISVISATASIQVATSSQIGELRINGERIKQMEVAATYGGASEVFYLTESGRRIKKGSE